MKTLQVILIVALLMTGLTAYVLPSLPAPQGPSSSLATSIDHSHATPTPGIVPLLAECDCHGGGC